MSLKQRLLDDLKHAMKVQDAKRLATLRMLKARILEAEVAGRAEHGLDYALDDTATLKVLGSYAKQRKESIESYQAGGRTDLAAAERTELAIVEEYLPQQLGEDQVRQAVREAIVSTGATSKRELGLVIKTVMAKLQGACDGKLVSKIVGELLP
jgi:hypothetical protein